MKQGRRPKVLVPRTTYVLADGRRVLSDGGTFFLIVKSGSVTRYERLLRDPDLAGAVVEATGAPAEPRKAFRTTDRRAAHLAALPPPKSRKKSPEERERMRQRAHLARRREEILRQVEKKVAEARDLEAEIARLAEPVS